MIEKYFGLEGNVVMVTGASRGLGKAIAVGLAEAGADMILIARDLASLEQTAAEIEKIGRKALSIRADISEHDDVKNVIDESLAFFGRVDVLINNAGISGPSKFFHDFTENDWMSVIKTNLEGTIRCTHAVSNCMIKNGGGKIINIASVLGTIGSYHSSIYSMTKAAIIQMTRNLSLELARYNVHVNAIAPGVFDTDMIKSQTGSQKAKDVLIKNIPLRRFGKPEEMVGLAILLASKSSSYITGAVYPIDGGFASSKM